MYDAVDPRSLDPLLENLGACLAAVDLGPADDLVVVAANHLLLDLCGLAREGAIGRALRDVFHGEGGVLLAERARAAIAAGRAVDFDGLFDVAAGRRWFRGSLMPVLGSGPCRRLICTFQDTTAERVEALRVALFADQAMMLSDAIEATNCGISIFDSSREGRPLVFVNRGYSRLTGYAPDEVLGQDPSLLCGPETDATTLARIDAAMAQCQGINVELVNYRKDGSTFWNEVHLSPVPGGDGTLHYWVAVQTDITDRRALEEELRASRELFALAIDGSRDGIFDWDIRRDRIWFSDRWRTMLQLGDTHFEGGWDAWRRLVVGTDAEEMRALTEASWMTGEPMDATLCVMDGAGRRRHVLCRANTVVDARGRPIRMVGAITDVSDIREAEEALRLSEADYRTLAENGSDIIMRTAADGLILYVSPACERVLGYKTEEMTGRKARAFILPEDRSAFDQAALEMYLSGGGLGTYRTLAADGSTVWLECTLRVLEDDERHAAEAVVQARDVTERIKRDIALKDAAARLEAQAIELAKSRSEAIAAREIAEQADRAKSQFLATMSHELRTPLNAILGFSEIIRDEVMGVVGAPVYREYASFIHDSGSHLLSLINDILDLSKIEAGKRDVVPELVDVGELVGESIVLIAPRAERGGVTVEVKHDPDCRTLTTDARALKQILLNLLSNATKFTPTGGKVTMIIRGASAGRIEFIVRDTGIGIPEEHLDRVFEPFHQVDAALARAHDGTGLGLPLVRSLARMLGGTVRLKSKVGSGTSVALTLPLGAPELVDLKPPRAAAGR